MISQYLPPAEPYLNLVPCLKSATKYFEPPSTSSAAIPSSFE